MSDVRYIKDSLCPDLTAHQILTLVRVGEECAEIQQAVAKILRFGLRATDEVDRSKVWDNYLQLRYEVADLRHALKLLGDTLHDQYDDDQTL